MKKLSLFEILLKVNEYEDVHVILCNLSITIMDCELYISVCEGRGVFAIKTGLSNRDR